MRLRSNVEFTGTVRSEEVMHLGDKSGILDSGENRRLNTFLSSGNCAPTAILGSPRTAVGDDAGHV